MSGAPTAASPGTGVAAAYATTQGWPGLVMARWALGLAIAGWLVPLLALVGLGLGIGAVNKAAPHRHHPQAKGHGLAVSAIVIAGLAVIGSLLLL